MPIYYRVNRIRDTLLMELLAIRLGEPTTLAKSLVMAKPADCGSGCRPHFPRQQVAPYRVSAATFSSFRAPSCLRSRRFSTPC